MYVGPVNQRTNSLRGLLCNSWKSSKYSSSILSYFVKSIHYSAGNFLPSMIIWSGGSLVAQELKEVLLVLHRKEMKQLSGNIKI